MLKKFIQLLKDNQVKPKPKNESTVKPTLKPIKDDGRTNQQRQMDIGVTHYFWSTSGDERVCDHCKEKDGKRFAWDNPPEGGHPGEHKCEGEGYCRCTAIPDLDHLLN